MKDVHPPRPRQLPINETIVEEKGHKVSLVRFLSAIGGEGIAWEVRPLDRSWRATFTNQDDARLFFNIKNGGL
jgi:hypothetical protein